MSDWWAQAKKQKKFRFHLTKCADKEHAHIFLIHKCNNSNRLENVKKKSVAKMDGLIRLISSGKENAENIFEKSKFGLHAFFNILTTSNERLVSFLFFSFFLAGHLKILITQNWI